MRAWIMALSALGMLLSANAAKAERRVALVVGNGAYKYAQKLPNAPPSAKAMAALLRNIDFEVIDGFDLTRDQMTERLLVFGKKAEGADLALFYYSGQGIALGGSEYLLPIDADIKSEMDVKLGAAMNLRLSIDQAMSGAKVKLVFLDASRSGPFGASSVGSVASDMNFPEDTLVGYATGPGQVAPDGKEGSIRTFTRALIAHIAAPGVEIQQAMTQVRAQVNQETNKQQLPWGYTYGVTKAIYLVPPSAAAPAK
jgi:uncharacterized caspase-like protein